ncbi:hypothetical protein CAPTEDRAFT_216015 [Capitella teleta]|uniref:Sulfotransferase domain-containing protein n=1 Tax=Capitella teleta TaxID=283909 RepID=R7TZW6_CAPTE|nr:hypothetical protein CAPTEDRAFT_216015 [Capitella teleta]|eukprot:ELT96485.1 hypothetical protein CAPTEDRAFT_216015 [Capitella teleta]
MADILPTVLQTMLISTTQDQPVQKVLLVTYFRGGSTFLAELFNQNSDAFYWYEPYADLYDHATETEGLPNDPTGGELFDGSNNTLRNLRLKRYNQSFYNLTKNILDCNFKDIDVGTLKHNFITSWTHSNSFLSYRQCMATNKERVDICLGAVQKKCELAKHRVIKTIRTPLEYTQGYLDSIPDLKIIHSVRDPRGILHSRRQVGVVRAYTEKFSQKLCTRMVVDWRLAQEMNRNQPKRVMVARYEDLVRDFEREYSRVYAFVGAEAKVEIMQWFLKNMHGTFDGDWGTSRNSDYVANRWKTEIDGETLGLLTERCGEAIRLLRYSMTEDRTVV